MSTPDHTSAIRELEARIERATRGLRKANAANAFAVRHDTFLMRDSASVLSLAMDRLEFDDECQPTNMDAVIRAIKQEHTGLFFRASADGGAGLNAPIQVDQTERFNKAVREAVQESKAASGGWIEIGS